MLERTLVLFTFACGGSALLVSLPSPGMSSVGTRAAVAHMLFGRSSSAVEDDFQRRQDKLAQRQALAKTQPKGTVEVTFPQKGNKVVKAMQGDAIGKVCQKAGMRIKFDCKNGRCGTCQVRLNGRAAAKVCQGATIPGGATRKLKITLDNP
eukprot:CAMPEP_0183330938 /NCGR_PEP_ID=MMETSP0164_2-20130417/372_1 /TAXON_ID=221442 /ORGANISM="Coccolithus pelagicus ssp braarudi, Strain PLY182g" /LENGTH=150 /DNA_ID=CAMNT_0025499285 /DNA_START=30 /DNA_END=482 /DNA_ORIENTATION=-